MGGALVRVRVSEGSLTLTLTPSQAPADGVGGALVRVRVSEGSLTPTLTPSQAPAGGVDAAQLGHAREATARQVEAPVDLHLPHVELQPGQPGLQSEHLRLQPGHLGLQTGVPRAAARAERVAARERFVTSSAARC